MRLGNTDPSRGRETSSGGLVMEADVKGQSKDEEKRMD